MDKQKDEFTIFCNECGWSEATTGLPYSFCPKCKHVNIGFSYIGQVKDFNDKNNKIQNCEVM